MKSKFDELIDYIKTLNLHETKEKDLQKLIKEIKNTRIISNCNLEIASNSLIKVPDKIQKYDLTTVLSGGKVHLAIVYKVDELNNKVYCISFTTDENYKGVIDKCEKSRLFPNSLITCSLHVFTIELVKANWRGIYDNKKEADKLFRTFKQFYKNLLKL